jgi:thiamine biosynthesis lipoprotein
VKSLALAVTLFLGQSPAALAAPVESYSEARYVMGTILEITLFDADPARARRALDAAFATAERLDRLLTNYDERSEIGLLNRRAGSARAKLSPETYEFLALSRELSARSGGAFDITVGALVKLWKEAAARKQLPQQSQIREARALVDYKRLALHPPLEASVEAKGMAVDTGGIGKGYAVDRLVRLLRSLGIEAALVNFGRSSIYALGSPPGASGWRLLVRFPGREPLGTIALKDRALSASDALGRSAEIAGRRYGHIIDPATGVPLTEGAQAVVIGRSAAEAEVLSKYVLIRGWGRRESKPWGEVEVLRVDAAGNKEASERFPLER